jgi:hypothetical protein
MAFRALPSRNSGGRRPPLSTPVIAIYKNQTQVSLPRALLREAGLSDLPGAKVDVLIGEGSDAGHIAIIEGPRFTLAKVGSAAVPHTLVCRFALGAGKYKSRPVAFEVGRKQLILTLPADFPLRSDAASTETIIAPAHRIEPQAYAAE